MKKTFLMLIAFAMVQVAQAQIELKVNPLGALFGRPDISAEYITSESFGIELSTGIAFGKAPGLTVDDIYNPKQSGFSVKLAGKYYLSPQNSADGWYTALYVRQQSIKIEDKTNEDYLGFKRSVFAAGIDVGRKWVMDSGFLIDFGVGFGKAISEKNEWLIDNNTSEDFGIKIGVDLTAKFAIGYRFGESGSSGKKKKSSKKRRK